MIIAHNLQAMNTQRQFNIGIKSRAKSTEKLSSGLKINRASDDAAGLAISEKMRRQIRGLNQGSENIETGVSYCQVADGALEETNNILQRINELSIKAANGTLSDEDRMAVDHEIQQSKVELSRVFETTSFNDRKIWPDPTEYGTTEVVGSESRQFTPVTAYSGYGKSFYPNAESYEELGSSFKINANNAGISVSWKAYNGNDYTTETVSWDDFRANGYQFKIGDYFKSSDTDLFLTDGVTPAFDFTVRWKVDDRASNKEIAESINGSSFSTSFSTSEPTVMNTSGISVGSVSFSYPALYASYKNSAGGFDFANYSNNDFITPSSASGNLTKISGNNTSDITTARSATGGWEFGFEMEGIGHVKASLGSISYYSNDTSDAAENTWWVWRKYSNGTPYKSTISRSVNSSLSGIMSALTGDSSDSTPGLLTNANGGCSNSGGVLSLKFSMTSDNQYTYLDTVKNNSVGSFYMTLSIAASDTEQGILDKINGALNSTTVLDIKGNSKTSVSIHEATCSKKSASRDYPVTKQASIIDYGVDLGVHSGPDVKDHINLRYDTLRLNTIGLENTNCRTAEDALKAIDSVGEALSIVSEQRSLFGAYQNRLEHAQSIDNISAENTTSAESVIRDTDMAKEMVNFSMQNILAQAGQSMLAQANQSNQRVLDLLG